MKTTAIIAEYNPFHNGHQYQIEETRRQTGADFILVLMSGDFVQRGAPALCNKYIRAKMALLCGADAVIELPCLYALSSAEFFAGGAITLLNQLNVIDTLSFGSESGDLSHLQECACFLTRNSKQIDSQISVFLKKGFPYPTARAKAMSESFPDFHSVFSTPNNILGLEYCKTLLASESAIRPFTLKREGGEYHNVSFPDGRSLFASASAIRSALKDAPETIKEYVPTDVYQLLLNNQLLTSPFTEDAFSELLHYKLLTESNQGFSMYLDCTPDLSDRICRHLSQFTGFSSFCKLLKSKEITYTRISRVLMHILLNIKTPESFKAPFSQRELFVPYARLLGFRRDASPLLSSIKKSSSIPLLSKLADAGSLLDERAFHLLQQDILCASVYEAASFYHTGKAPLNEMKQSPIIV